MSPKPYCRFDHLPLLSSASFTWIGNHGIADVSDLGDFEPARLFGDAGDVGFRMRSTRTGDIQTFVLCNVSTNVDEDIFSWKFRALHADYAVEIFND